MRHPGRGGTGCFDEERGWRDKAKATLLKIARGEISYDFETAREMHAERERSVGDDG